MPTKPLRVPSRSGSVVIKVTDGTRITLGEQPIMIGRANDSTLVLTDDYAPTDNLLHP